LRVRPNDAGQAIHDWLDFALPLIQPSGVGRSENCAACSSPYLAQFSLRPTMLLTDRHCRFRGNDGA